MDVFLLSDEITQAKSNFCQLVCRSKSMTAAVSTKPANHKNRAVHKPWGRTLRQTIKLQTQFGNEAAASPQPGGNAVAGRLMGI
jgi:imidazoleglycerol phosphate dehydratase HisB